MTIIWLKSYIFNSQILSMRKNRVAIASKLLKTPCNHNLEAAATAADKF